MTNKRLKEFKYYYRNREIEEDEYVMRLCNALMNSSYEVNMNALKKTIDEARHKALTVGSHDIYLRDGEVLRIERKEE